MYFLSRVDQNVVLGQKKKKKDRKKKKKKKKVRQRVKRDSAFLSMFENV